MASQKEFENQILLKYGTGDGTDNACTPCLQDGGKRIMSVVFCLECAEHLCISCRQHHRNLKLTSTHHLLEIENGNVADANNKMTESCPEHPGRCIEYICENHQTLCCKTCRDISHLGCVSVRRVLDEASRFVESGEISKVEECLKSLKAKLANQIQTKRKHTVNVSNQVAEALSRIKTETTKAVERINKLAEEADSAIKTKSSDVTNRLQNEMETIQNVLETLNTSEKVLNTVKQNAREPQVYTAFKKADYQLKKYSLYADEIETNMKEPNVHFEFDNTFLLIKDKLTTVGNFKVGRSEPLEKKLEKQSSVTLYVDTSKRHFKRLSSTPSVVSKRKKAIPVGGHSVRIPGDKTTCHVTGSEILQDGRILLADHHNKSIKLFNKNCNYINHIILTSRPNDIAVIGENEIATSLIDENVIQILTVDNLLCLSRRIETTFPYYGLACDGEQLYGSTTIKEGVGEIHALNLAGKFLGSFSHINEQVDLIRPSKICIDKNKHFLYINDLGRNSLFCVDISLGVSQCNEVFTYTDRNLELRSGLAIDTDGEMFIFLAEI
ncbi:uncharacterized protein LOC128554956 [Mercenaria mercenaria]|uniref:uncharacterized protein LOC128554956 n=1 Tax=Mercenaria mercenaria TaxID=6596 RepID=UPI00234ED1E3|nr:uncharacterized protein LOC128554956 [Mercenaria mercenaria]